MITVAHSPDADDLFMYYPIAFGWMGNEFNFTNCALDIETLNQEALIGKFDISAISFALYPFIKNNFALLRTGVSFGNGYGPKLIKKKGKILGKKFSVALSGQYTTNAMLFKIAYPNAKIIYKNFLEIEGAVLNGEVDAGVLIHESILTYDKTLEVEREIWDIWCDLSHKEIPLPLGGMAIRRSIPLLRACECEEILMRAVDIATKHKILMSKMLLERDLIRVDAQKLDQYLNLYANSDSINLSDEYIESINVLYKIGFDFKIYKEAIECQEYMIPNQYKNLRLNDNKN